MVNRSSPPPPFFFFFFLGGGGVKIGTVGRYAFFVGDMANA